MHTRDSAKAAKALDTLIVGAGIRCLTFSHPLQQGFREILVPETVAEFFSQHLSVEVTTRLVQPFVSGLRWLTRSVERGGAAFASIAEMETLATVC